jgi:hypothetical protein
MQKERRDPMHTKRLEGERQKALRLEARNSMLNAQCWLSTLKNPPAVTQLEIHNQKGKFMAIQPFSLVIY